MIEAGKAYRPAELAKLLLDVYPHATITFDRLTIAYGVVDETVDRPAPVEASVAADAGRIHMDRSPLSAVVAREMGKPVVPEIAGDLFDGPTRKKRPYEIKNRGRVPLIRFDCVRALESAKKDGKSLSSADLSVLFDVPQETIRQALVWLESKGFARLVRVPGRTKFFTRTSKRASLSLMSDPN